MLKNQMLNGFNAVDAKAIMTREESRIMKKITYLYRETTTLEVKDAGLSPHT
ncbi:MAG: hypothetical protein QXM87_08850 [Candidatus Bathyarchaeia archaeon]